jgi:predicted GIY-YIG superfamily endonuclease
MSKFQDCPVFCIIKNKCQSSDGSFYVGSTANLKNRVKKHNQGIETAIAFSNQKAAAAFEKYLKSHSGRAFAKKRL